MTLIVNLNRLPKFGLECTSISPPRFWQIFLQICRPGLCLWRLEEELSISIVSNILLISSWLIVVPLSQTVTSSIPLSKLSEWTKAVILIVPFFLDLNALISKLNRTCWSRFLSNTSTGNNCATCEKSVLSFSDELVSWSMNSVTISLSASTTEPVM